MYTKIEKGLYANEFSVPVARAAAGDTTMETPIPASTVPARSAQDGSPKPVVSAHNDHIIVTACHIVCAGGAAAELGFLGTDAVFTTKLVVPANGTLTIDNIHLFDGYSRPGSSLVLRQVGAGTVDAYAEGYHWSRQA